MKRIYTAVFTPKESGSGYYCRVPDLPGCITTGKDIADALAMITDAANLWLLDVEDEGKAAPASTPITVVPHEADDICTLIQVDTEAYRKDTDNRAVRKNVSLPAWMVNQADKRGINCSQVLQDALRQMLN